MFTHSTDYKTHIKQDEEMPHLQPDTHQDAYKEDNAQQLLTHWTHKASVSQDVSISRKLMVSPLKAINSPPRKLLLFSRSLGILGFLFGFYKVIAGNRFGNFYTKLRITRKRK